MGTTRNGYYDSIQTNWQLKITFIIINFAL
ncbi:hypothetical protein C8N37_107175 [Sphingobacterium faecium]|nr:hypothetical protein C8N37_107175 [Sphingobacterium faecium]